VALDLYFLVASEVAVVAAVVAAGVAVALLETKANVECRLTGVGDLKYKDKEEIKIINSF